jgi:hypothetical protein
MGQDVERRSARVRGFQDVMTPEPDRERCPDADERAGSDLDFGLSRWTG